MFSEASRRTIKELRKTELYELGEISKTNQCQTYLTYSQEKAFCCTCGVLYAFAMTNKKDQNSIWDNVCSILYREREKTILEGRNTEENDDNMTIGKQKTRQEL